MQGKPGTLRRSKRTLWFERGMAILATINFGLVLFNVSYIPLRDFYFRYWPELTRWYDPIKGIEPNRETTAYLETVERLQQQVSATGLESPEAETILASLGNQSIDLINEDPFALANKSGSLEKIKNRMQDRISIPPKGSAKEAFTEFWSQDYLLAQGFNSELNWFETQISPAIASNYYRGIGENGEFIGGFWRIDLPFMVIFLLEYLGRTYLISRRFTRFTWRDALIWRWYDVFLFVPIWRWLRIIPVAIRLDQSALLDLERVRLQAIRNVIASFAQELTEVVVVQFINQVQAELKNGNLMKQVFEAQNRRYIDLNNTNELETIATHLVQTTVFQVIPQLKPDIEALLRYSLESSLKQMPLYESMQRIPGLQTLPQQMVERLVSEFSQLAIDSPQKTYESVRAAAEDSKGVQLSNRLVRHFGELLGQELREKETLNEIESLLIDFLEEFKLNYIQRVDFDDFQQTLAEHQQLKRLTPRS